VAFDDPASDTLENTNFLKTAIKEAAILPSTVG
jgi:hypothetical protein